MNPVRGNILLEPVENKKSEFIITNNNPKNIGRVLKVGENVKTVTPGLKVLFKESHKTVVSVGKDEYWLIEEDAILGYFDEQD